MSEVSLKMSRKQIYVMIATIVLIAILDFFSKIWAENVLGNGKTINIFGDILRFRLIYNTGGVFGIFPNNAKIFQVLTGVSIVLLITYFVYTPQKTPLFIRAISLILGGAFGNFIDRFFRHGVVDFIDMGVGIYRWPTYNVADSSISVGAVLLIFALYQIEKLTKEQESK